MSFVKSLALIMKKSYNVSSALWCTLAAFVKTHTHAIVVVPLTDLLKWIAHLVWSSLCGHWALQHVDGYVNSRVPLQGSLILL